MKRSRAAVLRYRLRRDDNGDIISCSDCGCEIATAKFIEDNYQCYFCANMVGKTDTIVTKEMLSQGLNILRRVIEREGLFRG